MLGSGLPRHQDRAIRRCVGSFEPDQADSRSSIVDIRLAISIKESRTSQTL